MKGKKKGHLTTS